MSTLIVPRPKKVESEGDAGQICSGLRLKTVMEADLSEL